MVIPDVAAMAAPGGASRWCKRSTRPTEGVTGLKQLGVRELAYKLSFLATSVQPAEARLGLVSIRDDSGDESSSGGASSQGGNGGSAARAFSPYDREMILRMRESPDVYRRLAASIAPTVYGHDEVKKGVLLMLFGGVHKVATDRTKLRGDINCCLVGDPSTAKSQFLKFVLDAARAVYSVARRAPRRVDGDGDARRGVGRVLHRGGRADAERQWHLLHRRVRQDGAARPGGIHEAMEQQTISIAKAGIQATLNARASILAAANPTGGRYDKHKSLRENLNLTSAIMSRFDLFFVVLDEQDERTDQAIAQHIVSVHQHEAASAAAANGGAAGEAGAEAEAGSGGAPELA